MTINVCDYSDHNLPGCESILIDSENYIDFRNHLVDLLGTAITQAEAIRMYNVIVDESPSHLIDAREYVLNELQYEIRRAKRVSINTALQKSEAEILQDWAVSLAERTDGRFYERSETDDVLDLINVINQQRTRRSEQY